MDDFWANEGSRAAEVLGGEGIKYRRYTNDRITLKFTQDEWRKIFNIKDDFKPCGKDYAPYVESLPIQIHFVRDETDERT